VAAGLLAYGLVYPWVSGPPKINWQPWSPEAVRVAVRSGKTAFVDFTAGYCTICKQNKAE